MIKNLAVAALLGLVSANEVKQKTSNGEEFPVIVLARRHQPVTPVIEILPANGEQPMGFVAAVPSAVIGIERNPSPIQPYHK